ncbi:hypothetical protein [Nannocystis pusilla]|uniref:hypothetical protein n=1 Tax=Nannocystis pusilla TaxID=889268 RepID=UPI003DA6A3EE
MPVFRISKYDPSLRDAAGAYTRKEWTSHGDVGKVFDGAVLTLDEYLAVEERYLELLDKFLGWGRVEKLKVCGLEVYDSDSLQRCRGDARPGLSEDVWLDGAAIREVARLVLREVLWCRLEGQNFYLHFGYDFYMYIGGAALIGAPPTVTGLFVERIRESPHGGDGSGVS